MWIIVSVSRVLAYAMLLNDVTRQAAGAHPMSNSEAIDTWFATAGEAKLTPDSRIEALRAARAAGWVTRADVDAGFADHWSFHDSTAVGCTVVSDKIVAGSGASRASYSRRQILRALARGHRRRLRLLPRHR